jgi:hypothetical protein
VQNGTFNLVDRFDPLQSELYLLKGVAHSEYRMLQFNPKGGLDNSFNATHYDPRFDGSLRFKLYLRTNKNREIIRNVTSNSVVFLTAYLASAVNNFG